MSYGQDENDHVNALGMSPDGSTVFVTGYSTGWSAGGSRGYGQIATVAYEASNGDELWVSRYDVTGRGGAGEDLDVSPDGSTVFVTGYIGGAHLYDYATVAYDASTGAELWARRYNGPTDGSDEARAVGVSADGSAVFVTGVSYEGYTTRGRFVTLAYDAATGSKLWTKRYHGRGDEIASGRLGGYALEVSPDGSQLFVTGTIGSGSSSNGDYGTLAYDTTTGAELWATRYSGPGNRRDFAVALGLSSDGSHVFVTGQSATGKVTGSRVDFATVAYDTSTGDEEWVTRYDGPGHHDDHAFDLAVSPDDAAVFVTGTTRFGTNSYGDSATVAYDASSGAGLWTRRYDGGFGHDQTSAVAVSPDASAVYVTGGRTTSTGGADCVTMSYDAASGADRWLMHYEDAGCRTVGVSPNGSTVYVAGGGPPLTGYEGDYLTVAYDAQP